VRRQTGKGANLALFGGAIMALCSGRTKRARLSFPDSFSLVHLPSASSQKLARICNPCSGFLLGSFGGAKEMNIMEFQASHHLILFASSSYFFAISEFVFLYVSARATIAGLYRGLIVRQVLSKSRAINISLSISNLDSAT
jgi:hypothetical protein